MIACEDGCGLCGQMRCLCWRQSTSLTTKVTFVRTSRRIDDKLWWAHIYFLWGSGDGGGRCKSFAASYSEVYNEPDAIEYNSTERLYLIGYFYSACQADSSNTQIVCNTLFVVYNLPLLTQTQLKLSISIIFTKYISTQYIWLILYGNYRGWYNI